MFTPHRRLARPSRLMVCTGIVTLSVTLWAQVPVPPGYLAVLHGNVPMITLQNPANGAWWANWTLGGTTPRTISLQYDETGLVTGMLVGYPGNLQYNVPSSISRLDVAAGLSSTVATLPNLILSAIALDHTGAVMFAGRSTVDGGCVYRLSPDFVEATIVTCLQAGRTPAALARTADGDLLVGWNDDAVTPSMNYGNGILILNAEARTTATLNEVLGAGTPYLADLAVAPGGRIYIAASPSEPYLGGSISWVSPSEPATRNVLLSGQMGSMGWSLVVRPAQMAIVGSAESHTVYVADPWGVGGGGGGMGGPGGLVPFNGGLAAIASTGGSASRISGYGTGPFGVAATGASIAIAPEDGLTGTRPVTLTFDRLLTAGTTSLTISDSGPAPVSGFSLGSPARYYDLLTAATFSGDLTVCFSYAGVSYADETALAIHHWNGSSWEELPGRTLDLDRQTICGRTASLSPFVVAELVPTDTDPPVLSLRASPVLLWPPNGTTIDVTVSGTITDESGPVTVTAEVVDEYGELSRGLVAVNLPLTIPLLASRLGTDRDGRTYQIIVTAADRYGNAARRELIVRVPHDRR